MHISRRASYNLLKDAWSEDPSISVKSWQVEDYRQISDDVLFSRLTKLGNTLDINNFISISDSFDSPEDMADFLEERIPASEDESGQIYLLVFELWRRLTPEKQSLSVFCDELDRQIFMFDKDKVENEETLQDVLMNLQTILEENIDGGAKPAEVFNAICTECANNLEDFLYDYVLQQLDLGNESYAAELIEGFEPYLKGNKWFDLLKIHLVSFSDIDTAEELLKKVVHKALKDDDLEYNLDVLAFMAQIGDQKEFTKLVKKTIPVVTSERDFKDLLEICKDYFHYLDIDPKEQGIEQIIQQRRKIPIEADFNKNDQDAAQLVKIIN